MSLGLAQAGTLSVVLVLRLCPIRPVVHIHPQIAGPGGRERRRLRWGDLRPQGRVEDHHALHGPYAGKAGIDGGQGPLGGARPLRLGAA